MRIWPLLFLLLLCACASSGVYHPVEKGQTLYRISRVYGVDQGYLMQVNGIRDPSRLKAGTMLYVPGVEQVRSVPVTSPVAIASPREKAPPQAPEKKVRQAPPRPSPRTKVTKAAPPARKDTASIKAPPRKGALGWPLKGSVVRRFSKRKGGASGIEIAAREGSVVKAAAAGKVIYSDNQIRGFGHLVILQHDNELFTIYGFNRRTLVKAGSFVSQGQKIALSGRPPAGGQPRIHFEVRRGKTPVNPILYLP